MILYKSDVLAYFYTKSTNMQNIHIICKVYIYICIYTYKIIKIYLNKIWNKTIKKSTVYEFLKWV